MPTSSRSRRSHDGAGGFTLLELMVVMGIVALLAGVGFGFLQRGSTDLDAALAIMRDQLRYVANTAKSRLLPTEIHVTPATDSSPVRLEARVLRTVGVWHLEEDERWLATWQRPNLTGTPDPHGRFGGAWRPDPESRSAMLTLPTGELEAFALPEGFVFRLELRLEQRAPVGVARLGRAFELELDADLVPSAKLTLSDGARPGLVIAVTGVRELPLHAWVSLELGHDGRVLWLAVDGREQARVSARGRVFQQPGDSFEVGLGNAPPPGLLDEITLLAHERGDSVALPSSVDLRGLQGPVRFGRRGELLAPAVFELVQGQETVKAFAGAGGIVRLVPVSGVKP